ncbi:HlyU family transcriptional regulator [Kiloniella antarctica]|uniref:HlyU family transcriptional regulator n=1 Tax=Kiloniella antarctica TaxID=1550907 RepID=A0ABW5BNM2_9PROT
MSFFSKLFGNSKSKEPDTPPEEEPVFYKGYAIRVAPGKADNGQWRLSGYIVKASEEESESDMERFYLRADTFPSREEAVDFSLRKGRQIIDEQGDRLFVDGALSGRA